VTSLDVSSATVTILPSYSMKPDNDS